jgi:hypothetical protein
VSYFFAEAARTEHLEHVAYYEARQAGLGVRYLAAFDTAMVKVCEAPTALASNFPLTSGAIGYRASHTTSSTGRLERTLKFLSLPRIDGGRVTG